MPSSFGVSSIFRDGLALAIGALLVGHAGDASAGGSPKIAILSPGAGFVSDGELTVDLRIRKSALKNVKAGSRTVTLDVEVPGCDAQSFSLTKANYNAAQLTEIEFNKNGKNPKAVVWTVSVDVSSCQCADAKIIHHCPATGSAFDTSAGGDEACGEQSIHIESALINKVGKNMCKVDPDQDQVNECAVVDGELLTTTEEKWVGNWVVGASGLVCEQKTNSSRDDKAPKGGKK